MSDEEKEKEKKKETVKRPVVLPDGRMTNVEVSKNRVGVEQIKVHSNFKVEKFKSKEALERNEPYEVVEFEDNVMLNEGANILWTLICGGGGYAFNSGYARIGVGDSNTTEDPAQSGLLGGNQLYKGMDVGYPIYGSGRQAVFRSTFLEAEANWNWWEYTVDNGYVMQQNINRKVQDLGVKPNTEAWRMTVTLRF